MSGEDAELCETECAAALSSGIADQPHGSSSSWAQKRLQKRGKKGLGLFFFSCNFVFWLHRDAGKGQGESGGIHKLFLLPNAPRRQLIIWDSEVMGQDKELLSLLSLAANF